MLKLIKIEVFKVKNSVAFWVISGMILILFLSAAIGLSEMKLRLNLFYENTGIDTSNYFRFPYVWQTFTWIAGWFNHFFAIMIIILIGNEFSSRMIRQQIALGINRNQIFTSKLALTMLISAVMPVIIILLSVIYGIKYTEDVNFSVVLSKSYYLITYYLQVLAYSSFAMMIVFLLRTTGLSFVLYLGYLIFEALFRFVLRNMLDLGNIIYFLPAKAMSQLTPRPSAEIAMTENLKMQTHITDITNPFSMGATTIIALFYIFIFWGIIFAIMKKRDL
jgi:ABC-type transport system involved in multi-copper enzyme maturation permease subunit